MTVQTSVMTIPPAYHMPVTRLSLSELAYRDPANHRQLYQRPILDRPEVLVLNKLPMLRCLWPNSQSCLAVFFPIEPLDLKYASYTVHP